MSPLVVVGDALLDIDIEGTVERVCPDAPVPVVDCAGERRRPGGAALAACLAAAGGHEVVLVAPAVADEAGDVLAALVAEHGVRWCRLPATGSTRRKRRVRVAQQSLLRLDDGHLVATGAVPRAVHEALGTAAAVLVADYGAGTTALPDVRAALQAAARRAPLVWDPHPRGERCTEGTTLLTPNEREAVAFGGSAGSAGSARSAGSAVPGAPGAPTGRAAGAASDDLAPIAPIAAAVAAAERVRATWRPAAVAVTLGARGAVLVSGSGTPLVVGADRVDVVDPCGAGDCFAATAALALAAGAVPSEAVAAAVRAATAYVASAGERRPGRSSHGPSPASGTPVGGGATGAVPSAGAASGGTAGSAAELAAQVRAAGGTVVVAGGCFDLLHRGHVELLAAARRLGDCLVVALNSDASVRGLKGEGRPVRPEAERAAVLAALASVDAVAVFDEPSPARVLDELRPHLFVKGGDYAGLDLPEQAVLDRWGGRVVTVPYLPGQSTSRILEEVRRVR